MNVEALDGFFAVLIAGPETWMPGEYYGRDVGRLRVREPRPNPIRPVRREEGDHVHMAMG